MKIHAFDSFRPLSEFPLYRKQAAESAQILDERNINYLLMMLSEQLRILLRHVIEMRDIYNLQQSRRQCSDLIPCIPDTCNVSLKRGSQNVMLITLSNPELPQRASVHNRGNNKQTMSWNIPLSLSGEAAKQNKTPAGINQNDFAPDHIGKFNQIRMRST